MLHGRPASGRRSSRSIRIPGPCSGVRSSCLGRSSGGSGSWKGPGGGECFGSASARRLELLEAAEVEDVLVLRFDEQLAALSADEFAERILRGIGAETVAAGE